MRRLPVATVAVIAGLLGTTLSVLAATGTGSASVSDDGANANKITVAMTGMAPAPAGTAYEGWLISDDGSVKTSVGLLRPASDGTVNATWTSPNRENLFGRYSRFAVTLEPSPDRDPAPSNTVVFQDQIAGPVMIHIRHLQVEWPAAPRGTGQAVGVRDQGWLTRLHSGFLVDAYRANNLAVTKLHGEHLVNIIEGSKGPNYGDIDGNGQVANPGDGFGLLTYAQLAEDHAGFAAAATGATSLTKLHSSHVIAAAQNIKAWDARIRDIGLVAGRAQNLAQVQPLLGELELLGNATFNGIDANGNGQIELIRGEAGADIAYVHSQLIGTFTMTGDGTPLALPRTGDAGMFTLTLWVMLAGAAAVALGSLLRMRRVNA